MEIKKVNKKLSEYKYIKALMKSAFPDYELFPHWLLMLNTLRPCVSFSAYYENGNLCGVTYSFDLGEIFFILYLAVDGSCRGSGYGSKILAKIKEDNPDKIIVLDVEPLDKNATNYEERANRIKFYEKNGIYPTGYTIKEKKMSYSVLSTNPGKNISGYIRAYKMMTFGLYNGKLVKE